MGGTLVIRFGALGDVCVTSWFLAGLAELDVPRPFTVVTKAVHAPLLGGIPGVDQVLSLERDGLGGLWGLAGHVRNVAPELWLDAHAVLRSRLLGILSGRRADARLRKDTLKRLRLIREGGVAAQAPALLDRLDALALEAFLPECPGEQGPGRARLTDPTRPPLAHLRSAPSVTSRVALAPGARWASKRWPDYYFADLLRNLLEEFTRHVTLLLGPDEPDWMDRAGVAQFADHPRLEVLRGAALTDVAAALARCGAAVTNDSGLLHLAEAVGTPVAALFGPTVRAFGYTPLLPESRLLEVDLECRPCSRTGARPCHRGDLACLTTILPAAVLAAVDDILAHRREVP